MWGNFRGPITCFVFLISASCPGPNLALSRPSPDLSGRYLRVFALVFLPSVLASWASELQPSSVQVQVSSVERFQDSPLHTHSTLSYISHTPTSSSPALLPDAAFLASLGLSGALASPKIPATLAETSTRPRLQERRTNPSVFGGTVKPGSVCKWMRASGRGGKECDVCNLSTGTVLAHP